LFDTFLDYVKNLFKSRLFPITLIYLALFFIIIHRLFVLQIVQGQIIAKDGQIKDVEYREIESARGNFYDCKGKILASNALTYSVVMEDSTKIESNEQRNEIIYRLINMIESNGDTLDNEFYIIKNKKGELEFTLKKDDLIRFKKKVYTYVLEDGELTDEQKNATAQEVYEFLKTGEGYTKITTMFQISDKYSVEDTLKIMSIRYALLCNYPKYVPITVASNISKKTTAAVEENSSELKGVDVVQQTHRVYEDSKYFANIIGYTGLINQKELDTYNADTKVYDMTDVIGKTGLEMKYEEVLKGTNGIETVSVNTSGKVIDVIDHTDPSAGNDVYLTIDSDLQIGAYRLLEREIANILLDNMSTKIDDYGSKGESAADIKIPIYEFYNALINNNIIDINHFNAKDATSLEKETYQKYRDSSEDVFQQLETYLNIDNTVTNDKAGEMQDYLNYYYSVMKSSGLLLVDKIPDNDQSLLDYKNNKTSLSSFIITALANNWIDLSKLEVGDKYYTTDELYEKIVVNLKNDMQSDDIFNKMIYRNLVFSYKLSGTEICLLLFDQGVLKYNNEEVNDLKNGNISPYDFIREEINSLEITPAMFALTPCSGSVVITNVKTGDVLALVSYPGYDNNKFAGKIDEDYFNQVNNDLSRPLRNKPISEAVAPGSTFKMVTAVAALEEGATTPTYEVYDLGEFTKITPSPKCHVYPSSHGSVNIMDALAVSCNYFFFEMGWRLSLDSSGKYNPDKGLATLREYATMFGLNKTSGIELNESKPQISTIDSVRSAIGQGNNLYTPVQLSRYVTTLANKGTCYNLTLLDKVVTNDGNVVTDNSAIVNHKLDKIKDVTWDTVQKGMYNVVNIPKGSVYSTFKDFGVTVAGKTGTSQISTSIPNNALFVSYAPYEDPEISITTVIPGGYTSHNTALLAKNIYSLYYGFNDIDTLLADEANSSTKSATIE
jgi:penicillin-binding protein 2